MSSHNYIGTEIKSWRAFELDGKTYSLSHLDSCQLEYVDNRNPNQSYTYRIHVTYSFHCFAKDDASLTESQKEELNYSAPKDSRSFNFRRYKLSKSLPDIIQSLGDPNTLIYHKGHENYATCKIIEESGQSTDYVVLFSIFREKRKLRLHVSTAYPEDNGIGIIKKVRFFTLAHNALKGKPMPKPIP